MRIGNQGWTYPALWAIDRERALMAREEYRNGAKLADLVVKYRVGYGTMQTVISGTHPAIKGLPGLARRKGTR